MSIGVRLVEKISQYQLIICCIKIMDIYKIAKLAIILRHQKIISSNSDARTLPLFPFLFSVLKLPVGLGSNLLSS